MHELCYVMCGSLGARCILVMILLYSGGPNGAGRRVGSDRSGGEEGLSPSMQLRVYAWIGIENSVGM